MITPPGDWSLLYRGIATGERFALAGGRWRRRGLALVVPETERGPRLPSWRLGDDYAWGPDATPQRRSLAWALLANAIGPTRAHHLAPVFEHAVLSQLDPDVDWHIHAAKLRTWSQRQLT